jgi:hypothetical protein
MPRFHFDLHEGGEIPDEEGSECADLDAACDLAVVYARDIAAAQVRQGHLDFENAIVIRDERGAVRATITLGEALIRGGPYKPHATAPARAVPCSYRGAFGKHGRGVTFPLSGRKDGRMPNWGVLRLPGSRRISKPATRLAAASSAASTMRAVTRTLPALQRCP